MGGLEDGGGGGCSKIYQLHLSTFCLCASVNNLKYKHYKISVFFFRGEGVECNCEEGWKRKDMLIIL